MKEFRNAFCSLCSKDYNYFYAGGRPRKYCFDCKPPKGRPRRRSENAYEVRKPFRWGHLPSDWFVSKAGNACRTIGKHIVVVFLKADKFWMSVVTLTDGPRVSDIKAVPENVPQALN